MKDDSDNEFTESLIDEVISDADIMAPSPEYGEDFKIENDILDDCTNDEIQRADSVIAKVMSNKIFLLHSKKARRHRRYNKVNNVKYIYCYINVTNIFAPVTNQALLIIKLDMVDTIII